MDLQVAWQQIKRDLEGWQGHLAQLKPDRKAAEAALVSMTQNVAARIDASKRKADIPEEIYRQMSTCHTAATEFHRQFWSAIYPPIGETLGGPTTLAQKMAKATRMAAYLTKTPEKVAAIVRAAEMAGVDRARVQTVECICVGSRGRTDSNGRRVCNQRWMPRKEHSNSGKRENQRQRRARGGHRGFGHAQLVLYNFIIIDTRKDIGSASASILLGYGRC